VDTTSLSSITDVRPVAVLGSEPVRAESSLRILVVEDDPNVRDMLALLLGTRWTVRIAHADAELNDPPAKPSRDLPSA